MPIIVERDDSRRQLTCVFRGPVTADDVIAARVQQAEEGLWSFASLIDTTDSPTPPDPQDLLRVESVIDALCEKHGRLGPVAMVAGNIELYASGRTFEVLTERFPFHVFRTRAEAQAWLDSFRTGRDDSPA